MLKYISVIILGIIATSCTHTNDNIVTSSVKNQQLKNKSNQGAIFTYEFDPNPEIPQVDMGITGTLVEKEGCLLLEAPIGKIYLTPIFPSGVSYWNKKQNSVYIKDKKFTVGKELWTNGVILDTKDKSEQARQYFKDQADISCLRDKSARLGTHTL